MKPLERALFWAFISFMFFFLALRDSGNNNEALNTKVEPESKWVKLDNLPKSIGLYYIPYKDDSNNGYIICANDYRGVSITFIPIK